MEKIFRNNNILFIILPLLLSVGLLVKYCDTSNRKLALKNSKRTFAIITQQPLCDRGCSMKYKFMDDYGVWYNSGYQGYIVRDCHKNKREGDTVYIRYSISDPEVTELIHCYWNEELRDEWLRSRTK